MHERVTVRELVVFLKNWNNLRLAGIQGQWSADAGDEAGDSGRAWIMPVFLPYVGTVVIGTEIFFSREKSGMIDLHIRKLSQLLVKHGGNTSFSKTNKILP